MKLKKYIVILLALTIGLTNSCSQKEELINNKQTSKNQSGILIGGLILAIADIILQEYLIERNQPPEPLPMLIPADRIRQNANLEFDVTQTQNDLRNGNLNLNFDIDRRPEDERTYGFMLSVQFLDFRGTGVTFTSQSTLITTDLSVYRPGQTSVQATISLNDLDEDFRDFYNTHFLGNQSRYTIRFRVERVRADLLADGQQNFNLITENDEPSQIIVMELDITRFINHNNQFHRRLADDEKKINISVSPVKFNKLSRKYEYNFLNISGSDKKIKSFVKYLYEEPRTKKRLSFVRYFTTFAKGRKTVPLVVQWTYNSQKYYLIATKTGVIEGTSTKYDGIVNGYTIFN